MDAREEAAERFENHENRKTKGQEVMRWQKREGRQSWSKELEKRKYRF